MPFSLPRAILSAHSRRRLLLSSSLLVVAACSKNKVIDESQVAAYVNDGEISVHQVQAVLQRQPRLAAMAGDKAASQVLEVLVDQELSAQAAIKLGLESEPSVIQALQLARREVLARVFHDRIADKASLPTSDEIDSYYDKSPALFSQRKLYTLQEFDVEAVPEQMDRLADVSREAKGAASVDLALRDLGVRYSSRQIGQAAEDIPMGLLQSLSTASVGQSVFVPQSAGARIFSVLRVQSAPVDRRTANDSIVRFLQAERKRKLVAEAMSQLRQEGQIRYVGSFAGGSPYAGKAASAPR